MVEKSDTAWILSLRGEHDLSTRATLQAELEAVFAHGTRVVVDMEQTTFVDSSILGVVFAARQRSRAKPEDDVVVVAPPQSLARRVIRAVAPDAVIPVYDSRDQALAALAGLA